jgi:hypothetical protein
MTILPLVLAMMTSVSPVRDHTILGTAIAARIDAEAPLFKDDADKHKTAAWLVAVAFRESSLRLDAVGDHGHSVCAFQIYGGAQALLTDADRCVSVAFDMLRTSMRYCPAFPLAWYAAGGDAAKACASPQAQRLSRDRSALALRLVRDVKVPTTASLFLPRSAAPRPSDPCVLNRREEEAA